MGDYSFFIKSASFLILLNAVVFSFPQQVEALTGGKLNTSTLQGTNVSVQGPRLSVDTVDLQEAVFASGVAVNSDDNIVRQSGVSTGVVEYNISNFLEKNGEKEVFIDVVDNSGVLETSGLKVSNGQGNETISNPTLVNSFSGDTITFYFTKGNMELKAVEDSVNFRHTPEKDVLARFTDTLGVSGFTSTIQNLISLYTAPSSGNQVLGAIFTLYLLGFTVFFVKEVIPG